MKKSGINRLITLSVILFTLPIITCAATRSEIAVNNGTETLQSTVQITEAKKLNGSTVEIRFSNQQKMLLDFYGNNIVRMFQDNSGNGLRDPQAQPEAKILLPNAKKTVEKLNVATDKNKISISTDKVQFIFDKTTTLFSIKNLATNKTVVTSIAPITFEKSKVSVLLAESTDEYFFGGGVQNGRFSHKGKVIAIENQNSWTDGGVASPNPFYWSTNGYGFMWHTFKKGSYDFGAKEKNTVKLSHDSEYLDVFFMVNDGAAALLNDFYQLTGNPVLVPKFGFYQGHLNAYNRDYWKEDPKGILFEDGKRYKESQKDNGGIKESLNGENNNYQFSARAVIDRYKQHDMPLGWILPNDGYGAGYGQTSTLEGNIQNLKEFGTYARKNGVQIGLWTQSDLHPKEGIEALLQRDITNEMIVAGVNVLKTDVAWVGAGYSFGLNGIQDVANIMTKHNITARPFIITLDGWAGTQQYATVWSGDQTGGVWEYIRFHIPTYIGSGLSGQPNISSDMDGIFGGKNVPVNVRDFQWKTFTPMQLNMDGWGSNEKYPHALGEPATSINRNYLKLKSQLLPYSYSIARTAVDGLPMIRAMFLEEKNAFTLSKQTQYQFMYGPDFLVAPVYQNTKSDTLGNDIRNHIYLPEGNWVDYFSGQVYKGGRVINNFDSPLWKLPVFVKQGAIIPMANASNNPKEINQKLRIYEVYPYGKSSFKEYDDDGFSNEYLKGKSTETVIESIVDGKTATITVKPTTGSFNGQVKEKTTEFRINVTKKPKKLLAKVGSKKVKLKAAKSIQDFESRGNVFFYNPTPEFNQFATKGSEFENIKISKNPQMLVRIAQTDVTANAVSLKVKGFEFNPANELLKNTGTLATIQNPGVFGKNAGAYTLTPTWEKQQNADYYEIEKDGILYSTIKENELIFENLTPETEYSFKARAVNKSGTSEWTSFSAKTNADPLQFAIKGIAAESTAAMQPGESTNKLFDFDESNMMHTKYGEKAIPFDMIIDLKSVNNLDKLVYLPRTVGTNGIIQQAEIFVSDDKENWTNAGSVDWKANSEDKTFVFADQPVARYIKLTIQKSMGDYASGREMYIFKVPGTESFYPGDINNDRVIDSNDYTSYMNYTGLRLGDGDFEGYVSKGDVNKNNLIDAYDISNVATQLEGGISGSQIAKLAGKPEMTASKASYAAGDTVLISVKGLDLQSVNALSFAIPYNKLDFDYVGIELKNMKAMQNLTYDRLHTNGDKVLYPTFVNLGNEEALEGNETLFEIRFVAKRALKFNLKITEGLLVDKFLNNVKF